MSPSKPNSHITVNIFEFLKLGNFGPICLGMPMDDLLELLGPANQLGGQWRSEVLGQVKFDGHLYKIEDRPIWKYGIVELYWGEKSRQLYMIHFDDTADQIGLQKETEVIQYEPWLFGKYRPLDRIKLEQGLADAGIKYQISTKKVYGEFILQNGIILAFDYDGEYNDQIKVITQVDEKYDN
jgi:hypothetical protein